MTPVRPTTPSLQPQAAAGPADAARIAAQRAFFDAAMGRAPPAAPPAPVAAAPTPAAARAAPVTLPAAAPEPARILRPGSLLDIRV